MTADKDTFLTTNKHSYKWPFSKPLLAKPAQPPIKTKHKNFFLKGPVEAYCHCDGHLYEPDMNRYNGLAKKEKILIQELEALNQEMAILANGMLDHPCDTDDDKMQTIYETDYVKRGLAVVKYRKLIPAIDSPIGMPVKSQVILLNGGYRDPLSFRYSTFPRPNINPCPCVTFSTTPANLDSYYSSTSNRSEYQDTISKMGLAITKSRQQYMEPLPSSRRRSGDYSL